MRGRLTIHEIRAKLDGFVQEYGIHPIKEMFEMVRDGELTNAEKIKLLETLANYMVPKLKTTEVHKSVDSKLTVTIKRFGEGETTPTPVIDVPTIDSERLVAAAGTSDLGKEEPANA